MSYGKHTPFVPGAGAGNALSDEARSVTYADLPRLLAGLDAQFEAHGKTGLVCVGFAAGNTVGHALLMLYLLAEKINFFVLPSHAASPAIPPFCDTVLSLAPHPAGDPDPVGRVTLRENPHFAGAAVEPGTGYAFFASSGTTGPAKYICFPQENLLGNARHCVERFGLHVASRVLIPVPVGHMYGLGVGLLPALLAGAGIRLVEKNNILKFIDQITWFSPDTVLMTPTVAKMVLLLNKRIAGKRTYISAGERLDAKTHQQFEACYGLLINLYGSTEQGAIATSRPGDENAAARTAGVLFPLGGVEVRVDGDPAGEILSRHPAGFRCYVDQHGAPLPGPAAPAGWYPTRDLGRRAGDGGFSVAGRIDNCVNRSGFLVSLEEIESVLRDLFGEISRVVVFAPATDEGLVTRLVAVCELGAGFRLDGETVKKICRSRLSRHLVPDEFYFIRHLPRLGNDKPDRAYLVQHFDEIIHQENITS